MDAKKEQYRRTRGAILKVLAVEHPRPVDSKVINALLDDLRMAVTEEECQSHLAYLAQKGLLVLDERKMRGICLQMITISPRGLDVLDGFGYPEPGVDVRF